MKLILGLGNPDKEYEKTRHNIGFMIVDKLCHNLNGEDFQNKREFKADISQAVLKGEKIILAKPRTYMNNSGEAAAKIVQFYKILLENICVVYDDLDLPLGQIRLRQKGGAGTHNGMKSLIQHLGNGDFPRLRFGIESRGVTAPKNQETSSFVLSPFTQEEISLVDTQIQKTVEALKMYLEKGLEIAMNQYNTGIGSN